jgi:hypothetical protein
MRRRTAIAAMLTLGVLVGAVPGQPVLADNDTNDLVLRGIERLNDAPQEDSRTVRFALVLTPPPPVEADSSQRSELVRALRGLLADGGAPQCTADVEIGGGYGKPLAGAETTQFGSIRITKSPACGDDARVVGRVEIRDSGPAGLSHLHQSPQGSTTLNNVLASSQQRVPVLGREYLRAPDLHGLGSDLVFDFFARLTDGSESDQRCAQLIGEQGVTSLTLVFVDCT